MLLVRKIGFYLNHRLDFLIQHLKIVIMRNFLFSLAGIILLPFLFFSCEQSVMEDSVEENSVITSVDTTKQSYIVVLDDDDLKIELSSLKSYKTRLEAVKTKSKTILVRNGITNGEIGYAYGTALYGFSVEISPDQLSKLEADASIKYIEKNLTATIIQPEGRMSRRPDSGGASNAQETTPWGITRVNGGVDATGKTAWVIDTGIDLDHEDLNVDESQGATFIDGTTTPDDDNGHGTHCAGVIGAIDNEIGVIGVAANATLVPVKVLDKDGSGTYAGVIAGIDYVAENASYGDVANLSLGGDYSEALNSAVETAAAAGVIFTLAAGNESVSATQTSPASAEGDNIYTISAMAENNIWASYSNYGNPPVDFCEPGTYIYSTYKGNAYATLSGTSMAAPHAAGILLLGDISTDGNVSDDPDGDDDPIGVY